MSTCRVLGLIASQLKQLVTQSLSFGRLLKMGLSLIWSSSLGIIIYYIEAKFYSGFGRGTKTTKPQLIREIETGRLEADNLDKKFILIAITADYYYKPAKFSLIKNEDFIWTNWQRVATMIYEILAVRDDLPKHQAEFAGDLYQLLADKKLREYRGKKYLSPGGIDNFADKTVFFQAAAAKYRGGFIGFSESLSTSEDIPDIPERIFFKEEWV